jgi:hypothetical protein
VTADVVATRLLTLTLWLMIASEPDDDAAPFGGAPT